MNNLARYMEQFVCSKKKPDLSLVVKVPNYRVEKKVEEDKPVFGKVLVVKVPSWSETVVENNEPPVVEIPPIEPTPEPIVTEVVTSQEIEEVKQEETKLVNTVVYRPHIRVENNHVISDDKVKISFRKKPDIEVISQLRKHGFAFDKKNHVWFANKTETNEEFVKGLK